MSRPSRNTTGVHGRGSPFDDGDAAADTISKVIHKRRRKAVGKPSLEAAPVVKNFAAEEMGIVKNLPASQDGWERYAPKPVESTAAIPSRVGCRALAGSRAPVQRSERTSSCEDPCISSTSDRRRALAPNPSTRKPKMKDGRRLLIMSASTGHTIIMMSSSLIAAGQIVADFEIQHTAAGWQRWNQQVAALGAGAVAVCVETSQG